MAEIPLRRHADHDPGLICRPALGYGLCEVVEPDEGSEEEHPDGVESSSPRT